MRHIKKFNEEIITRQFNKLGKALSFGDRITDDDSAMNRSLPNLRSSHLKYLISVIEGKNKDHKPSSDSIRGYLTDIQKDLKSSINKSIKNGMGAASLEKKGSYRIIKSSYDEISNILRYGVPKYDPNDKYQYRNIVSILKSIYKLSYNDGN